MVQILIVFIGLIISIILGISSALLVKFIDLCFNDGQVLDWYYKILLKIETKYPKLAKALGLCPKCFGFWLSFVLFLVYHHTLGLGLIFFIPYIAYAEFVISHLFKDDDDVQELLND